MKLGVLTTSYPRWPGDPAGNFVGAHVAALRALGHHVDIIAAGPAAPDGVVPAALDGVRIPSSLFFRGGAPDALEHHPLCTAAAALAFTARFTATVIALDRRRRTPSRTDASGSDASGSDTSRSNSSRTDTSRTDTPRSDTSRIDTSRVDTSRVDTSRVDTSRVDAARWDAIIAHWLVPSAIAALPARAPLLAIAHGGDVHTLRRLRLLAPVLHALRARRAELVFVSDELRAVARREVPSLDRWLAAARVQPMGLDLARFAALPRTPTALPTVAIAARLVPIKGVDVALAALAHVKTPIRLVIAGDGPERMRLEHLARADNLAGVDDLARVDNLARADNLARGDNLARVEFLGAVDLHERDALLSRASCVVVPSRVTASGRTEGTPLIALEALAAGVPVVASAVGGLTALAPAARLVPPDDPRALAASIDAVLAAPPDPALLAAAVADLDWMAVASRLVRSR